MSANTFSKAKNICENFIVGCHGVNLKLNCKCTLFKGARVTPCEVYIRSLLPVVYVSFLSYVIGPALKHVFESSLNLRIPKRFNSFQVLKIFRSFLLRVTCVMSNTDAWQASVGHLLTGKFLGVLVPFLIYILLCCGRNVQLYLSIYTIQSRKRLSNVKVLTTIDLVYFTI